jgi:ammonium transporter, Amt family
MIDDTLGVFHTHAAAGFLGGTTTGLFAKPILCSLFLSIPDSRGAFYGGDGGSQFGKQVAGAPFVIAWNIVVMSIICILIDLVLTSEFLRNNCLLGMMQYMVRRPMLSGRKVRTATLTAIMRADIVVCL